MKLVCIDNTYGNSRHLELHQVYECKTGLDWKSYYILRIKPFQIPIWQGKRFEDYIDVWVDKKCFITLEEWRKNRLQEIGI
jgi:hypothetical protein